MFFHQHSAERTLAARGALGGVAGSLVLWSSPAGPQGPHPANKKTLTASPRSPF